MKLTITDLQRVFSLSKQAYIDDSPGELDNQQFLGQCYVKAVMQVLNIKTDVEFPTRISVEVVE